MKRTIFLVCTMLLFCISCKTKNANNSDDLVNDVIKEAKKSTAVIAKEGKGKVTLTCGSQTFSIDGVCGVLTTMGTVDIAIPDAQKPSKVFTISFKSDKLPTTTSSFKIVKSNYEDKDATHVSLSYTDMNSNQQAIWESDDASGNLQFIVNGNETKCSFVNIPLQANEFYNKGDLNKMAKISGEFNFYKN